MTNDESEDANAALDALLAAAPYLEDEGFSARVMHALPPPRTRLRSRVVGSACIAGIGLAALVLGPDSILSGMTLAFASGMTLSAALIIVCTGATALWAAATA